MIPPPPASAFEWIEKPSGWALVCRPLARVALHFFTTRGWRLGSASGHTDSWNDVASAMERPDRLVRVHQVHGAAVVIHRAAQQVNTNADADIILTDDGSAAIAIQTADCVPLLLGDVRTGAVAAAHAGWRGTTLGVATAAVNAMVDAFGSRPAELIAAIGPSIGPCCYEVGPEVREHFIAEGHGEAQIARWFSAEAKRSPMNPPLRPPSAAGAAGRSFLDLSTATRDQLETAGLSADRIFAAGLCTASHPDAFCSYRRDGLRAGRLAAVIRKG